MKELTPGSYWVSNQKLYCVIFNNTEKRNRYNNTRPYKTHIILPKTIVIVCSFIEDTAFNLLIGTEFENIFENKRKPGILVPGKNWVEHDRLLRQYKILVNEFIVYRHELVDNDTLGSTIISTDKFTRFTGKKKEKNLGTLYPGNKKQG